jgi:4-hydroxybenzoate polyprenyltransferase
MRRSLVAIIWKLSRAEGGFLAAALVFLPYYLHTHDVWESMVLALPIFPMTMCTFILNDINDIERDIVNHPDRPIPNGSISIGAAAGVYMLLFVLSLVLVAELIVPGVQYVYLLGFIVAINYGTIVNHIPRLKNFYVAFASLIPLAIVNAAGNRIMIPWTFSIAVFLFVLGKEMLMDVRDMAGDGPTLAKAFPLGFSRVAFALQAAGIVALGLSARGALHVVAVAIIVGIFAAAVVYWRLEGHRRRLLNIMKLQMVLAVLLLA